MANLSDLVGFAFTVAIRQGDFNAKLQVKNVKSNVESKTLIANANAQY